MRKFLYLALKPGPWRDIVSGRKKKEYRDYNDYYKRRLVKDESDTPKPDYKKCSDGKYRLFEPYTHMMFLRGNDKMAVTITSIDVQGDLFVIGIGKIENQ